MQIQIQDWHKFKFKSPLVEPSFQGVNIPFPLAFEKDIQRTNNYLANVEIKEYHVVIDGEKAFGQPVKNDKITYENIRKIANGH